MDLAQREARRHELIELDRKIREALLGQSETRYDLLDLQNRVRDEIRSLGLANA